MRVLLTPMTIPAIIIMLLQLDLVMSSQAERGLFNDLLNGLINILNNNRVRPENTPAVSPAVSPTSSSSRGDYCTIDRDHTMCKYKGPSRSCRAKTIFRTVSSKGKAAILDRHNQLRRKVAKGQERSQPPAANMKKLVNY